MYNVSAAYIAAMNKAIQKHRFYGTIGGVRFGPADVLQKSLSIANSCSDSTDLTIGSVVIGVLKLTLLNDLGIERGQWYHKEITLYFEQCIDEINDIWEAVPVGVFTIEEPLHTEKGIQLTAYDHMAKLNKEYPKTTTTGLFYDILNFICLQCGAVNGMTQEECEALPNGNINLSPFPENDCTTWRDLLHYLAQLVGGFATADRFGRIVIRRFGNETNFTIDASKRLTGSKFSDFITNYTGLSRVDMAAKETRYYHVSPDNGQTINLGSNPFIQYGTKETLDAIMQNILQEVNAIKFVPFNSAMVGNPAFDLGDVITYTGGTAGTASSCCIMAFNWNFGQKYAVSGVGKNPSLATAQSKADKDISGLNNNTTLDTTQFFTYINAQALTVGEIEQRLMQLRATNVKATNIDFWAEFKFDVTLAEDASEAVLYFRYTLDGDEELYKPVHTYKESGTYTFNLNYFWTLESVMQHDIGLYLRVDGGEVFIDIASIHALLKGQGMTQGDAWDGLIEIDEYYSLIANGSMNVSFTDELVSITQQQPKTSALVDSFAAEQSGAYEIGFTDDINIITQTNIFGLTTEDGAQLITEAGEPIITDGGGS